jgi:hypothetical protein
MRRRFRRNRRGALPVWVITLILLGVGTAAVSLVPSGSCNVTASVSLTAIQFVLGSYYSVNGVSATTTGYSSLLNWGALGFTTGLTASDILTVSIAGHTAQKGEDQLLPTLSIGDHTATDSVTVGYVPMGEQTVTATLTVNGQQQGSSSTTTDVSCLGW